MTLKVDSFELPHPGTIWVDYRDTVYKNQLTEDQERECARAFCAGIEAAFKVIHLVSIEDIPMEVRPAAMLAFRDVNIEWGKTLK